MTTLQRYRLTPPESANEETQALYQDFLRQTGSDKVPIYIQSLGHDPRLLRAYWEKTKGCLLGGRLPLLLKELVVFTVSRINGAAYCSACHAHAVLRLDQTLSYSDLDYMVATGEMGFMPPAHSTAICFAKALAMNANHVDDSAFLSLKDAGFSESEVLELLSVVDLAMMFNTYTSATQLPIDPEYLADRVV